MPDIAPVPRDLFSLGNQGRWFEDLRRKLNLVTGSGGVDHLALSNIGTNTHAQIDTALSTALSHRSDSTIHFTEGSIDHMSITNIGTNTHVQIDSHIADATLHFTEGSIDHVNISNIGTNTHAQIDTAITNSANHIADATIHFTEGGIDHTAITNIGTNSHAQIDTHIADATIHFTLLDEDDMSSDSDTQTATQQSIKAYVDAILLRVPTEVSTTYSALGTDREVFGDTDSGAFAVTLPAGVSGHVIRIVNTGTSSNDLTVTPNGAENLIGVNSSFTLSDGEDLYVVYSTTKGWY